MIGEEKKQKNNVSYIALAISIFSLLISSGSLLVYQDDDNQKLFEQPYTFTLETYCKSLKTGQEKEIPLDLIKKYYLAEPDKQIIKGEIRNILFRLCEIDYTERASTNPSDSIGITSSVVATVKRFENNSNQNETHQK